MSEPQYHWRRIPGTLALASTNLIASSILVFHQNFLAAPVLATVTRALSPGVWGVAFLASGLTLVSACIWRRWLLLNIGSGLSLFLWTLIGVSVIKSSFDGHPLSPIGFAMAWWMMVGQIAMLFAPLWAGHDEKEVL